MAVEHNDIMELQKVFDDRYVLQSDCNDKQGKISDRLANDDKRIDLVLVEQRQMRKETKNGLKFNNWLTGAVLGAIIVALVGFYFFFS